MYLLDTNHCSSIIFGDSVIVAKMESVGIANVAISSITEGELLYMAENSTLVADNLAIVENFTKAIPVYNVTSETSRIYAKLKTRVMDRFAPKERNKRRKIRMHQLGIDENDLWIAAIAIEDYLTIVSTDRDFQRIREAGDFP
jgi:tRNA(fMet)-specific endonuclease VapC